ncbi:hypothetical protein KIN20_028776 [Parelaphostrongylus tenuis]|uniref:Uncharacterized protein n=1 Tax=Parelaphostrongylus tenuis TaxID=148309 RepID=A0AAD5R1C9_PARTN|nr:hypothetical protein KIN20_028776 [Parelaphostrongylus tenuis]
MLQKVDVLHRAMSSREIPKILRDSSNFLLLVVTKTAVAPGMYLQLGFPRGNVGQVRSLGIPAGTLDLPLDFAV